ncbi:hypothetical protein BJX63DRAFT_406708 [Aspergillus granulosus]|uniref:Integral membrane protein n=1 Tax=Aspergillus granulosus TaxID=176169 RepID=A0ABR4H111_9EURO
MVLSQNPLVHFGATASGTVAILFGINALFRPAHALSFFELDYPTTAAEQSIINNLMYVYGARDIFMGLSCYIAGCLGNNKTLGWTMLGIAGIAWADGAICWANGHGQWNHWSYAPQITIVGAMLLGVFDRK